MILSRNVSAAAGAWLAVAALTLAQQDPLPSPAHWYRFNGNLSDAMGGVAGTPNGAAVFVSDGACGQALATGPGFEVSFGNQLGNFGAADFTLAMWVKIPPGNVGRQACSKREACNDNGSHLDLRFTENSVSVDIRAGGQFGGLGAQTFLYNNLWRSVVITRAGVVVSLFVDGNGLVSANRPVVPLANNAAFKLSGGPCLSVDGIERLAGAVDELQVYDVALAPLQVLHLHQRRSLALITQPSAASGCAGGSAEFFAQAAPGDPAVFQWQAESPPASSLWTTLVHGGSGLGPQTAVTISSSSGGSASTLRLAPLDAADATRYRCLVTHACGTVASIPAALTLTNCCTADFNGDGFVNPDDLSDFVTCFFLDVQFPAVCPAADFNADGFRDPDDLSDFITAFFTSAC